MSWGGAPGPLRAEVRDIEVQHGYTMQRLHLLALKAAGLTRTSVIPFTDQYETAWQAITEHLLTAPAPPEFHELINAGKRAIGDHIRQQSHHNGYYLLGNHGHEPGPIQRFAVYWDWHATHTRSPEDPIVESLALQQIWPRLRPRHRAALEALATYGDYPTAAAALGSTTATFYTRISEARKAFFTLWHEHETPSKMWGHDNRHHSGKQRPSITVRTLRQRERRRRQRNTP